MNWLIITVYANLNILSHQNNTPNRFFRDCEKKSTNQQIHEPTSNLSKIPKTRNLENFDKSMEQTGLEQNTYLIH